MDLRNTTNYAISCPLCTFISVGKTLHNVAFSLKRHAVNVTKHKDVLYNYSCHECSKILIQTSSLDIVKHKINHLSSSVLVNGKTFIPFFKIYC
jgi:hypothetical protein